jgi:hypothetical protein
VRVARFQVNADVSYAMFAGGGSSWAEARMKEGLFAVPPAQPGARPDLDRPFLPVEPDPVPPWRHRLHHRGSRRIREIAAFQALVTDIVALAAGEEREGHPVAAEGPQIGLSAGGPISGNQNGSKGKTLHAPAVHSRPISADVGLYRFGLTLGRFDPKAYRQDVARNTDFRKFDDGLKMTIDVDPEQVAPDRGPA